jgi:hypothetical protein
LPNWQHKPVLTQYCSEYKPNKFATFGVYAMVITDLQYLQSIAVSVDTMDPQRSVSQAAAACIAGGRRFRWSPPKAEALATATAQAIGKRTYSETSTDANAVAGLFSSSSSGSYAKSSGLPVA